MYWSWKPGHHTLHGGSTLRTLPKAKEIYSQQGCFRVHWGSRRATCIIGSSQFRSPVSNKNVRIVRGMWHWLHSPDLTRLTTCLEEMPVQLAYHPKRQKAQSCWSTSRRHFSWYPRGCKRFMVRKHVAVSTQECTCRMIEYDWWTGRQGRTWWWLTRYDSLQLWNKRPYFAQPGSENVRVAVSCDTYSTQDTRSQKCLSFNSML